MNNYAWLASQNPCSLSIEMNEHACNYVTAKEWIEEHTGQDEWSQIAPDLLQSMKDTNTIWRLQIYPNTPVGFNVWFGPTLDSVIEQARADDQA